MSTSANKSICYQCPKCGKGFTLGTKFCQNCGCNLETEFVETPTCPECGKTFPAGTKFCKEDGTKLVSPEKLIPRCVKCGKEYTDGTKFCSEDGGRVIPEALRSKRIFKDKTNRQSSLETEIPIDTIRIIIFILGTLAFIIVVWIVLRFLFAPLFSGTTLAKATLGPFVAFIFYIRYNALIWVIVALILYGIVKFLDNRYLDEDDKSQLAKVGLFFSSIVGYVASSFLLLLFYFLAKAIIGF